VQWPDVTLDDVREAARAIAPHLRPTPLYPYAGLRRLLDAEVWVKHENHQPVGAFKVRGGVNLVSRLGAEERERGLITASTGTTASPSPTRRGSSASRRGSARRTASTRSSSTRCSRSARR
jgi:threonine dehydratase